MLSSPFLRESAGVPAVMAQVLAALLPGIAFHLWYFGPALLVNLTLASATAVAAEAVMLKLRRLPVAPFLSDLSALVTAWLLALSIPSLSPWWLPVVGTAFAIVVAKQLYGGLGGNLFNPAMVGYAVLIISFPQVMTRWPAPEALAAAHLSLGEILRYIFTGVLPAKVSVDALAMATPLDILKTQLLAQHTVHEIVASPVFGAVGGRGAEIVALGYLAGGLFLWARRIITWHIPVAYTASLFLIAGAFTGVDSDRYAGPLFHLATGGTLLGAFFILTDPVTAPVTPKGKLLYGAGAALLTYVIRVFGGYPDGVAFAVLLMNVCVPLIDAYTRPPVFGRGGGKEG